MKMAIISDIHGNEPALAAVLADAQACGAEQYLFTGDIITDMPYTNEVTERIRNLPGATVVKGNREDGVDIFDPAICDYSGITQIGAAYQACQELTPSNRAWLAGLPSEVRMPLPGTDHYLYATHFIHALNDNQKISPLYSSVYAEEMQVRPFSHAQYQDRMHTFLTMDKNRTVIKALGAPVVIFGHTHIQWHAYCDEVLVINAGSCGLPLDFDIRAAYTLLHMDGSGLVAEERRVPYEVETVIRHTRESRIYKKGTVWCELVIESLRTGRDNAHIFFALANAVRRERQETGRYFTNEAWAEAAKRYFTGPGNEFLDTL